jgi:hypothetical protein
VLSGAVVFGYREIRWQREEVAAARRFHGVPLNVSRWHEIETTRG